jgi:hypothetical protein
MSKLQLSDAERENLSLSRALATDSDGNETLRGLYAADSVEYLGLAKREGLSDAGSRDRYIALHPRHASCGRGG